MSRPDPQKIYREHFRKPMADNAIANAVADGMIPKADLIDGRLYFGHCRNADLARWDTEKQVFIYIRVKFGNKFEEEINHPEDDNSFDLFVPVELVTNDE